MYSDKKMKNKTSTCTDLAKPIRFLKIVLGHYQEFKFKLPKVFVRKYGNTLSNWAHIQAPTGPKWKVELIKCDGEIWFRNGWEDFVHHFSLREGSSLLFEYEGDSRFNVLFIGDPSAMESKYPIDSSRSREETDRDVKEEEILDDDGEGELQIMSNKSGSAKTGLAQASRRVFPSRRCGSFEASGRRRRMQSLATKRKATTLPSGGNSKSEPPFFEVEMQPSYVTTAHRLHIPGEFWKRHLTMNEGVITLRNPNGRTWPVRYKVQYGRYSYAHFCRGWKAFAMENKLQEGDSCRFELQKGIKTCFLVTISRVDEDVNHHSAAGDKGHGNKSKHEAIASPSTMPRKRMRTEHARQSIQRLSSIGSAKALERASILMINSNHPSFKLVMTKSYVHSACPSIPASFYEEHLNSIDLQEDMILLMKDKSWPLKLTPCSDRPGRLGGGWIAFKSENNLQLGDVCVFEMISATNPVVLKVSIFSASRG